MLLFLLYYSLSLSLSGIHITPKYWRLQTHYLYSILEGYFLQSLCLITLALSSLCLIAF